jgi:hypothetical protein
VELEIRDVRGSFLKKITLGAFQGQAGAEFDQGDVEIYDYSLYEWSRVV